MKSKFQFSHLQILLQKDHVQNLEYRVFKFNRTTYVINATADVYGVDNNVTLTVDVYGMMGNEYRRILPEIVLKNFCSTANSTPYVYPDIVPFSNFPPQDINYKCPWEAKKYFIQNVIADMSSLPTMPFNVKKIKGIYSFVFGKELDFQFAVFLVED